MNSFKDNLHQGAEGKLFEYGRALRQLKTKAEEKLWERLRNRKANGLKFRRQHPLDKFVADFYCHEKRLVIELDGGMHESKMQKEKDRVRTEILDKLAITVVRFKNEEVLKDSIGVTKEIIRIAGSLPFANKR